MNIIEEQTYRSTSLPKFPIRRAAASGERYADELDAPPIHDQGEPA